MSPARVIFSTGSLYVLDLVRAFELSAEAGFDGVEVMCDDRYSTRDPNYLKALSKRFEQPINVLHTPFTSRLMGWRNGDNRVERIRRTLDLAETLKVDTIVVHLPDRIRAGTLSAGNHRLRFPVRVTDEVKAWMEEELPRVQANTRVKIAIENMPRKHIMGTDVNPCWWNTVPEWSKVHHYLTLDTTHWATMEVDPLDAYRASDGRTCHVHLSNFDGREHRLPHKGSLDLAGFLSTLAADGFDGTVCCELSPDALAFNEEKTLRRNLRESLKFCREHLGQKV